MNEYPNTRVCEVKSGIHDSMCGFYKAQVVNPRTNEIVADYGWQKNLILNQGMDSVAIYLFAELTEVACAGTGSRPNSISGGTSEITQSGNTVYLNVTTGLSDFTSSYSTYPAAVQVGDVLKYANNSESMVAAVNPDGLNLTVSQSYTFTDGQTFTIWKTSQTGMELEVKRAGTGVTNTSYLTGVGNCGQTDVGNARTFRRTYDFTTQSLSETFTELGVAWYRTGSASVFSRVVCPVPLTVPVDYKLRVIYDLQVTFTPASSRYLTASISGWPVAPSTNTYATESIQKFLTSTITVGTGGSSTSGTACLDPSSLTDDVYGTLPFSVFASASSASLAAFGSAVDRGTSITSISRSYLDSNADVARPAYVPGSYVRYKKGTFSLNDINIACIRSIGFGYDTVDTQPYEAGSQVMCVVFDQNQTKLDTQTLSFTWKFSWSRVLG